MENHKNDTALKQMIEAYFNSPISNIKVEIVDFMAEYEFYEYPLESMELSSLFVQATQQGSAFFEAKKSGLYLMKLSAETHEIILQLEVEKKGD